MPSYAEWIAARTKMETPRCKCASWTADMVKAFPELTRVRGHVRWPGGGRTEHWWCTSPDGTIVDPTAAQFAESLAFYGETAALTYEPWQEGALEPVGKCYYCGGYIWPPRTQGSGACSLECAEGLEEEYGGRRQA